MAKQRKSKNRSRSVAARRKQDAAGYSLVERAKDALDRGNLALEELETRVVLEVESKKEDTEREARILLGRIRRSRTMRALREVSTKIERGVDVALDKMGLVRKRRHLELLARAKKRAVRVVEAAVA